MTSLCGFVRGDGLPYSMYYAVLHNNREHDFVRLSISMGHGWQTRDENDRLALCMDVTSRGEECVISVQDQSASPQQDFHAFGKWLDRDDAREHPALPDFISLANFIIQHDPALSSYLAGSDIDWAGRKKGNGAR
jgi:hypothetical protein